MLDRHQLWANWRKNAIYFYFTIFQSFNAIPLFWYTLLGAQENAQFSETGLLFQCNQLSKNEARLSYDHLKRHIISNCLGTWSQPWLCHSWNGRGGVELFPKENYEVKISNSTCLLKARMMVYTKQAYYDLNFGLSRSVGPIGRWPCLQPWQTYCNCLQDNPTYKGHSAHGYGLFMIINHINRYHLDSSWYIHYFCYGLFINYWVLISILHITLLQFAN